MYQEKNDEEHITPIFTLFNYSNGDGVSANSFCERPCVCHCVCRGSKATKDSNLEKELQLQETKELFKKLILEDKKNVKD